jgi:hypothetical protein
MAKLSITTLVLLAALTPAPGVSSARQTGDSSRKEETVNKRDDHWRWIHRDDAITREVSNRVEFKEDYSDIESIPEGGSVLIVDEGRGKNRRFEAANVSGRQTRSYRVDGREAAFDAEAGRWLAAMLNDAVIQGGYDAKRRVQRLIRERGQGGVLDEVSRLKGDYLKRIYLTELARGGNLDAQVSRRAIELIGREIDSDYEKASALLQFKGAVANDEAVQSEFARAVQGIDSDYERNRVLLALLRDKEAGTGTVLFVVKAAAVIKSDYEKARLLMAAASAGSGDDSVRGAILEAANAIESDYERGRVLKATQRSR